MVMPVGVLAALPGQQPHIARVRPVQRQVPAHVMVMHDEIRPEPGAPGQLDGDRPPLVSPPLVSPPLVSPPLPAPLLPALVPLHTALAWPGRSAPLPSGPLTVASDTRPPLQEIPCYAR